jgi:hypothetical protein
MFSVVSANTAAAETGGIFVTSAIKIDTSNIQCKM